MTKHTSDPTVADLKKQIEASEAKLVEYAHDTLRWKENRDHITESFRKLAVEVLAKGDASLLRQVAQEYTEIQFKSYSTFKVVLDDSNKEELNLHEAIGIFPAAYDLLELVPEKAFLHPVFGKILVALRKGRTDLKVGSVCQGLLEAIAKKIAEPPRKLDDLSLLRLLPTYEVLLKTLQEIWKEQRGDLTLIYKKCPAIKKLHGPHFVGPFKEQPNWNALNLLARVFHTNVYDLKRDLAKARRIKKALKAFNVEILPPMDFAELLMFGGEPLAERMLREIVEKVFRGVPAETLAETSKG